jgi:hypothetical protein
VGVVALLRAPPPAAVGGLEEPRGSTIVAGRVGPSRGVDGAPQAEGMETASCPLQLRVVERGSGIPVAYAGRLARHERRRRREDRAPKGARLRPAEPLILRGTRRHPGFHGRTRSTSSGYFATCSARIGAPISRNRRCASRSSRRRAVSSPLSRATSGALQVVAFGPCSHYPPLGPRQVTHVQGQGQSQHQSPFTRATSTRPD